MSASEKAEKAKEARTALMGIDPGFVEGIDALKSIFGARLTALQIGDIKLGDVDKATRIWETAAPYVRYQRPGEVSEEWQEIKGSIGARIAAGKRATSRKR